MKILDCTLRDGGYINNWRYNHIFIDKYIEITNKFSHLIEYIEIGFINIKKEYKNEIVGGLRNLLFEDIINFKDKSKCKIAVMVDLKNANIELLNNNDLCNYIDLIRIAFHKKDIDESIELGIKLKELGYKVSMNAMATTIYNDDELLDLIEKTNLHKFEFLYLADSYGSLNHNNLNNIVNKFTDNLNNTKVGLHLHNNMQNAISNFNNIQHNLKINLVDTTMFGMGRGAGNLPLETTILSFIPNMNLDKYIQLLNFIDEYIKRTFYKNVINWGYDLDYLLSGHLQIHPNYVSKMRDMDISFKNRFDLLKIIYSENKGKFFEKNYLETIVFKNKKNLI